MNKTDKYQNIDKLIILFQETKNRENKNKLFKEIKKIKNNDMKIICYKFKKSFGLDLDEIKQELLLSLNKCCNLFSKEKKANFHSFFEKTAFNDILKYKNKELKYHEFISLTNNESMLADINTFTDLPIALEDWKIDFDIISKKLTKQELDLINCIFTIGMTYAEYGKINNITEQAVWKRKEVILNKIRGLYLYE